MVLLSWHTFYQALGVNDILWSRVCKCWTVTVCVLLSGEGHDWQWAAGLCLWTVLGQDSGRDKKCHSADAGRSPALYSGWVMLDTCVSPIEHSYPHCEEFRQGAQLVLVQHESFNRSLGHLCSCSLKAFSPSLCPCSAFKKLIHPLYDTYLLPVHCSLWSISWKMEE